MKWFSIKWWWILVFLSLTGCYFFLVTQPNVSVQDAILTVPDGEMHYLVYGDESGLPPLVLLNGFGMTARNWPPKFINASTQHYTIYAVDYPGINHTELKNKKFTFTSLASDLNVLIEKIKQTKNVKNVRLFGWSLGTMVALRYANQYPDNVKSLVIVSGRPGDGLDVDDHSLKHQQVVTNMQAISQTESGTAKARKLQKSLINLMFPQNYCSGASMRHNICLYTQYILWHNTENFGGVDLPVLSRERVIASLWNNVGMGICISAHGAACPISYLSTIVIHGKQDYYINYKNAEVLYNKLKNSTLHEINNAGHGVIFQYPDKVVILIENE